MSKVYNALLQDRVQMYVKEAGGLKKAAKNMGLGNYSKLSLWLASKYDKGDVESLEQQIMEFFRIQDERTKQPGRESASADVPLEYQPTTISEHVYKTIRYCQLEKSISMIYGDSGIGKSMAALKYAQDNPATAVYMRVNPVDGVMSRFIRKLAIKKLKIPYTRDIGVLADEIADRLVGTNKVLILDEGQNLHFRTMELIRDWVDADPETGRPGVSIVLIGNRRMYTRMQGRNEDDFAQQLNRSRPEPVSTKMFTREDVEMMFPALVAQGKGDEIDFLFSICRTKWGLRNATYIYTDAVRAQDVSYESMQRFANKRGIVVRRPNMKAG